MSDLKNARERAREYRAQKGDKQNGEEQESAIERASGPMQEWHDIVSQRIEEAMREGHFNNLRNKGKPLNLERNPFVPADMEMAYHILENNDLPPGWITERTATLQAIDLFREKLRKGMSGFHQRKGLAADASAAKEAGVVDLAAIGELWREDLRTLNKRIETTNLAQPFAHLEIYKLVLEDEVKRAFASVAP